MAFRSAWIFLALPLVAYAADPAFDIPPLPVSLTVSGQPLTFTVSGTVSPQSAQAFSLNLHADLNDLQSHITPLLQAELNQSNRCGERISVEHGSLVPAAPAARLTVQLHFEKYACIKAFGKENATKLVAGNGLVRVLLTPRIESASEGLQTVRLDAEIGEIEADGSLGQMLHSEFGNTLRDKIRAALLAAIQKSSALDAAVPQQARPYVTLQSVDFAERGTGILQLDLAGRIAVPAEKASAVLGQFGAAR